MVTKAPVSARRSRSSGIQEKRDRSDLVRLGLASLLAQHQALTAGPGRDQMQGVALLGFVVGTARGLPIDGHNIGLALAHARDPFAEASREKIAIECIDDVVERLVARDALSEGQEAPQEPLVDQAPAADLDEVLRPRQ